MTPTCDEFSSFFAGWKTQNGEVQAGWASVTAATGSHLRPGLPLQPCCILPAMSLRGSGLSLEPAARPQMPGNRG